METKQQRQIAIGADIGGSHISCAAINLSTHEIEQQTYTSVAVDNQADEQTIIQKWADAIRFTLAKASVNEPVGIGFAMPGPFDYVNGIGLFEGVPKFQKLNGVNVGEKLKAAFGFNNNVPIRFMNDATAFAVGSVWADYSLSNKNVLAITLGTGFGSAFLHDAVPVLTGESVPELGCLYHLPYNEGIADETFSTRGLINLYDKKSGKKLTEVKEIAERAIFDEKAIETFSEFGANLADFLSTWVEKSSTNSIVIGGNISKAHNFFLNSLTENLAAFGHKPSIKISAENDLQAILGAARLAEETYWNKIKPLLKHM